LDQWDIQANPNHSPDQIIYTNNRKKVWWRCAVADDHRWRTSVYDRVVGGSECPFCSRRRPSSTNNLLITYPEIAALIHPTLNPDLDASLLSPNSHVKVWWKCPEGNDHIWQATPNSMKGRPQCGFCAGKRVSTTNSLAIRFPDIAAEFDLELNHPVTTHEITFGSRKKFWWRCSLDDNHVWNAAVSSRTGQLRTGCPECVIAPRSRREIFLSHEIGGFFVVDQIDHRIRIGSKTYDCDIVLRQERVIIEYDGSFWHQSKIDGDLKKTQALTDDGWRVIRVREEPLTLIQRHDVQCSEYEPIHNVAVRVLRRIEEVTKQQILDLNEYESSAQLRCEGMAQEFIKEILNSPDVLTAHRERESWDRRLSELISFNESFGTSDPATIPGAPRKLISWVNKQREQYELRLLSPEHTLALEQFDDWHWSRIDFRWRRQYDSLVTQVRETGAIRPGLMTDTLRSWVVHQRALYKRGQLAPDQIDLLTDIPGWSWTPIQDAWEQAFELLLTYVARTGTSLVPQDQAESDFKLGVWVNKQRGRYRRGVLEPERVTRLASLPGWSWTPTTDHLESMFSAFATFVAREGHVRIPLNHVEDGVKLGAWLNGVRARHRRGELESELVERLAAVEGFTLEPREDGLTENVDLVVRFYEMNPEV
jgi:G:T-mismatch repair DNA endonuclease (very short patch repair protein)